MPTTITPSLPPFPKNKMEKKREEEDSVSITACLWVIFFALLLPIGLIVFYGSVTAHEGMTQQEVPNKGTNGSGIHRGNRGDNAGGNVGYAHEPGDQWKEVLDQDDDNVIITEGQLEAVGQVERLQKALLGNSRDIMTWIQLGDAQLRRDQGKLTGGLASLDAAESYQSAIELIDNVLIESNANASASMKDLQSGKCQVYWRLSLVYQAARLLEKSQHVLDKVIDVPHCNDMRGIMLEARSKIRTLVGDYSGAFDDIDQIFSSDLMLSFVQNKWPIPFSLVSTILEGDKEVVPGGWNYIKELSDKLLPKLEGSFKQSEGMQTQSNKFLVESLQQLHRAMFLYFDKNTNNVTKAWFHLSRANELKSILHDSNDSSELSEQVRERLAFFNHDFFKAMSGSGKKSKTPIFIIGFPRSGTTLLESILDSHHSISGLGEASFFMNYMPRLQTRVPLLYEKVGSQELAKYCLELGEKVLLAMINRWKGLKNDGTITKSNFTRLIDKQNVNFHFVHYIHLIFPDAVILNLIRDPMDVVFSNYRLDLSKENSEDNTLTFASLAQNYKIFRKVMRSYEEILPGRITHVRYDDLVNDTEKVIRSARNVDFENELKEMENIRMSNIIEVLFFNYLNLFWKTEKHLVEVFLHNGIKYCIESYVLASFVVLMSKLLILQCHDLQLQ